MAVKKDLSKDSRFWKQVVTIGLILAAVLISLLFYKQKIEVTQNVVKNLTEDWQTYKDDNTGVSFKYPPDWDLSNAKSLTFAKLIDKKGENNISDNEISVRISDTRSIDIRDPRYAIQISIPFDKKNYLIFSTSTNSNYKEVFYNIPVTLVIGK